MFRRKTSSSHIQQAVCQVLEQRRLLTAIPIAPSTGTNNSIIVEFIQVGAQRSVRWNIDSGGFNSPQNFGTSDSVEVNGLAGNDAITVTFEDDYFQNANEISLIVNGGRGHDTITINGGPGYDPIEDEAGLLYVNGYDDDRGTWDESGDFDDSLAVYDEDTLYVNRPWGHIEFDDGDKRIPGDLNPDTWEGASDEVFVNDDGFTHWSDTTWKVFAGDDTSVWNTVAREGDTVSSGQVNSGRSFDPLVLTASDGDDTVKFYSGDDVTVNGGDGEDSFYVAPSATLLEGAFILGQVNGDDGDDLIHLGHMVGTGVHSLLGIGSAELTPFYDGGDGQDTVIFDDSEGENWGDWFNNNNENKNYLMGDNDIQLTNSSQSTSTGYISGADVESAELHMQLDDTSGGTFTSRMTLEATSVPLHVYPGNEHEDLIAHVPLEPILLYPSTGLDNVTIGSSSGSTVNAEFRGAIPVIGALQINATGHVALNIDSGLSIKMQSLSISSGGVLDVGAGRAIIDYASTSPMPAIIGYLQSGYNSGGWNGTGVMTSLGQSAIPNNFPVVAYRGLQGGVGYAEASDFSMTTFGGQSVDSTCVVLRFTLHGDANLDGDVDLNDVILWSGNYTGPGGSSTKLWRQGDWDFDRDVDNDDQALWSANFTGELGLPY